MPTGFGNPQDMLVNPDAPWTTWEMIAATVFGTAFVLHVILFAVMMCVTWSTVLSYCLSSNSENPEFRRVVNWFQSSSMQRSDDSAEKSDVTSQQCNADKKD